MTHYRAQILSFRPIQLFLSESHSLLKLPAKVSLYNFFSSELTQQNRVNRRTAPKLTRQNGVKIRTALKLTQQNGLKIGTVQKLTQQNGVNIGTVRKLTQQIGAKLGALQITDPTKRGENKN